MKNRRENILEMSGWIADWWKQKVSGLSSTELCHNLLGIGAAVQNRLYVMDRELIFPAGDRLE